MVRKFGLIVQVDYFPETSDTVLNTNIDMDIEHTYLMNLESIFYHHRKAFRMHRKLLAPIVFNVLIHGLKSLTQTLPVIGR